MFVPGKLFQYSLWVWTVAYATVEHVKMALPGQALALPSNIRLGWKGFPRTNTLAYYENP